MKKTNRILSLVVAASMMLGLTGCGSSAYSTGSSASGGATASTAASSSAAGSAASSSSSGAASGSQATASTTAEAGTEDLNVMLETPVESLDPQQATDGTSFEVIADGASE